MGGTEKQTSEEEEQRPIKDAEANYDGGKKLGF